MYAHLTHCVGAMAFSCSRTSALKPLCQPVWGRVELLKCYWHAALGLLDTAHLHESQP